MSQYVLIYYDDAPGVPLSMDTSSLPNGTEDVAYSVTFVASGGTAPYAWSIIAGTAPDLTFTGDVLSGTPTSAGQFSFTVRVEDSSGSPVATIDRVFQITIAAAPASVVIIDSAIQNGQVGVPYPTTTISAVGGTAPYTWSVDSGAMPTGLTIGQTTGIISGVPTVAGVFSFTLKVVDSTSPTPGEDLSGTFTSTISEEMLEVVTGILNPGEVNVAYSDTLQAQNGTEPYSWSFVAGNPAWLALTQATGALSGTPDTVTTYSITVRVTDSSGSPGDTADKTLSLRVFAEGAAEGPNDFYDTYSVHADIFKAFHLRSQENVNLARGDGQHLPSATWRYYALRADDPHPIAPDGAKAILVPRAWYQDRESYPDGAYKHFFGNTAFITQWGSLGDAGSNNWADIRIPVGLGPTNATSCTFIWDFWYDETFQSSRSPGRLTGWKQFFVHSGTGDGGTGDLLCIHDAGIGGLTLPNVCRPHAGPIGYGPEIDPPGTTQQDANDYHPAGQNEDLAMIPAWNSVDGWITRANTWTRFWAHFDFDVAGPDFTEWIAVTGIDPALMVGKIYDRFSLWVADETRERVRIYYRVPCPRRSDSKPEPLLGLFRIPFNNSDSNWTGAARQRIDLGNIAVGNSFTITVPGFSNSRLSLTYPDQTTATITYDTLGENLTTKIVNALKALDSVEDIKGVSKTSGLQQYTFYFSGGACGHTAIPAVIITPTGFTPEATTVLQVGGTVPDPMQDYMYAYARNILIFKDLTVSDSDTDLFAKPVGGDDR